ncbi:MAG TPA: DNA polymerase/3'-5' exonuclease PolX [Gemmatimonadota bacterium]|nr:DNA polymerase/3'-5' exonuclease PolX [Gemmatimonadota bacterium]
MRAAEVADVLEEIGRLLDFKGENTFKVRAYVNAARALADLTEPLETVLAEGRLREIPGIGAAIADKIATYSETGSIPLLDRLRSEIPAGVLELVAVPGLGPKRARAAFQALGVASLDDLEKAAASGRLAEVPGFGEKTARTILANLERVRAYTGRWLAAEARPLAERLLAALRDDPDVIRAETAGGLRRAMETVHDIDLVAASADAAAVFERFAELPAVAALTARGDTKATVRLAGGIPADLRVVEPDAFPFALQYFTGSQAHNTRLRGLARRRGLKLNEYALLRKDGTPVECADEAAVYRALGLEWIPPEIREDRGEIEAARQGGLPRLVERGDLRGVLHVHTEWSDGRASIQAMAEAARARGFEYLAVCDHSRSAAYAGGLSAERLREQREEIERVNAGLEGLVVLAGCEVDVLADGGLDYPDDVLAGLDFVVGSVHSRLGLPREEQTERVLRAIGNPWLDVLGHPAGRVLNRREGADLDMERVLDAAAAAGVALEVNGDPHRLDLDWRWHRAAMERGIRLAIDPDAHGPETLDYVDNGIGIARKGWVTREAVLNALPLDEFREALRRHR